MSHLKEALFKVSQTGQKLAEQPIGDDYCDLRKAELLHDLIYEVKEMIGHACDTLNEDENTFKCLKLSINAVDEDGELKAVIEKLDEATTEEDTTEADEASMLKFRQTGGQ